MKILHINECAGGVDKYLQMLTPLLKEKGLEQILVCSQKFDVSEYDHKVDIVEQLTMSQSFSPIALIKTISQIRNIIEKYTPDIVYLHSSMAGGYGRIACLGFPVKVVYNPHGWAFNMQGNFKSLIFLLIEKVLALKTDKIVCISEAEKQSALKKNVCNGKKLQVILNGVDVATIEDAKPISREFLNIPKEAFVVGMIGRTTQQKAADIFVKAAAIISNTIKNAEFIIVGDGENRQEIEQLAIENGVKLHITGWVSNPYSYLKIFDMAMLLSRWEGFGLALVEYMIAKKPFVATNVDAIPTIVRDGVDGILVEVDSPEQAAESIVKLYNAPELSSTLVQNAYIHAIQNYSIERVADEHFELFHKILGIYK